MVGSRKCKVCTVSGTNHISINDTFFGKRLRDVIDTLCDFELEERKMTAVFICQQCTRLIMQTDFFLQRVREAFKNAEKNVKTVRAKNGVKKPALNSSQTSVLEQPVAEVTPKKDSSIPNLEEIISAGKPNAIKRKLDVKTDGLSSNIEIVPSAAQNDSANKKSKKLSEDAIKTNATETTPTNLFGANCEQTAKSKRKKGKSTPELLDEMFSANKWMADRAIDLSAELSAIENDLLQEPSPTKTNTKAYWPFDNDLTVLYNSQKGSQQKLKITNCVICMEEFHSKAELYAHFAAQHSKDEQKQCKECYMQFKSWQKYESHILNEKCKDHKLECPQTDCGRRFSTKQKLKIHNESKHAAPPKPGADVR